MRCGRTLLCNHFVILYEITWHLLSLFRHPTKPWQISYICCCAKENITSNCAPLQAISIISTKERGSDLNLKDFWRYYLEKQQRVCCKRPPCSILAPSSLLELLQSGRGPYSPPVRELVLSHQEGGPATEGKNYLKSPNTSPHSWLEVQRQWLKSKLKPACTNSPDHSVSLLTLIQTERKKWSG